MRGPHVYQLSGFCIDPSAAVAAAREGKRVRTVRVDNRQLKVTIGRRGCNILPLHEAICYCQSAGYFDLDQRRCDYGGAIYVDRRPAVRRLGSKSSSIDVGIGHVTVSAGLSWRCFNTA